MKTGHPPPSPPTPAWWGGSSVGTSAATAEQKLSEERRRRRRSRHRVIGRFVGRSRPIRPRRVAYNTVGNNSASVFARGVTSGSCRVQPDEAVVLVWPSINASTPLAQSGDVNPDTPRPRNATMNRAFNIGEREMKDFTPALELI